LEYYFSASQFITLGGFYKDLTNPIEEFLFNGIGESNATSFINAPSAELFGIEAEFEKKWDLFDLGAKDGFLSNSTLVFRSNYTYTDSSVSADGDVSITPPTVNPAQGVDPLVLSAAGLYGDGRSLQGQSDHLANLQIGLENKDKGIEGTFLLNYSSERIRTVEDLSNGLPSILEQLPLSLDFVFNYDFELRGGEYELGFKVQNILGEGYEAFQELNDTRVIIQDYDIGTTLAASLKRRF